jgi:hypothetical protein
LLLPAFIPPTLTTRAHAAPSRDPSAQRWLEEWAEFRRLHSSEKLGIKTIARACAWPTTPSDTWGGQTADLPARFPGLGGRRRRGGHPAAAARHPRTCRPASSPSTSASEPVSTVDPHDPWSDLTMPDPERGADRAGRRSSFLSPLQKYEISLQPSARSDNERGRRAVVGRRNTICRIRVVPRKESWRHWPTPAPWCGPRSGLRAGAGPGRCRPPRRGAQGDGRQADAGRERGRWG